MSELVEYLVGYKDEVGKLQFVTAGAQSLFGRTRADKLVKKLGPPWNLWYCPDGLPNHASEHHKESSWE